MPEGTPGAWTIVLPGQPPSVNHTYEIGYVWQGSRRIPRIIKAQSVETWQAGVAYIVKTARPSGWLPGPRVRLRFRYYLNRKADCDNLKKAMNDAIATALGCDDDVFLSCDLLKETGHRQPRVEVEVENEDASGHRGVEPALDHA